LAGQQAQQSINDEHQVTFADELPIIKKFSQGLWQVRRALAHIPTYMIFDDHDVTDDWNLSRGWEEAAYSNNFSRRILGNALVGYWLCQGWGNRPENYADLNDSTRQHFSQNGLHNHDQLIDTLLAWEHWYYHLETSPKLIVLDTRTHRWRSESSAVKPLASTPKTGWRTEEPPMLFSIYFATKKHLRILLSYPAMFIIYFVMTFLCGFDATAHRFCR
jgi:hypothetical protein